MKPMTAGSLLAALFALAAPAAGAAQERPPIIDMHMHAYHADDMGPPPLAICAPFESWPTWDQRQPYGAQFTQMFKNPTCANPIWSGESDEALMEASIAAMERHNIIAVVSGSTERVAAWREAAPDRVIPGLGFLLPRDASSLTPDSLRALVAGGDLAVFGEVLNQYAGIAPDDERMEPYWATLEELDVPVGIHVGPGPPGTTYLATPGYRARLSSAFTLEEVLARHPKLRLYAMHAGYPLIDDMLATLYAHPQLYVDVSVIAYTTPREDFYAYLKRLIDGGFEKRIMWGSDQMVWPGAIEASLAVIEEAPFLSDAQKRDILYDNAARFLRLSDEEMAKHRQM